MIRFVTQTAAMMLPTTYLGTSDIAKLRLDPDKFRIMAPPASVPIGSVTAEKGGFKATVTSTQLTATMSRIVNLHFKNVRPIDTGGAEMVFNIRGELIAVRQQGQAAGLIRARTLASKFRLKFPKMGLCHSPQDFARCAVELMSWPEATWDNSKCLVWVGLQREVHIVHSSLPGLLLCGLSDDHIMELSSLRDIVTEDALLAPLLLYLSLDVYRKVEDLDRSAVQQVMRAL